MSSSSSNMSADTVLFGNGGKCNLTSNWRTNGSLDIPFGKMHLNCLGSVVQPDTSYVVGVGTDNELKLVANGGGGGGTTGGISTANITSAGTSWTIGQIGSISSTGTGTGAAYTVTAISGTGATSTLVSVNYTTPGTGYAVNDVIELINTTTGGSNAFATVTAITSTGGGGGDVFLNGKDVSATNTYNDNVKNEFKGEINFTAGSITNEPATVSVMTATDRVLSVDTSGKLVTNTKVPDSSVEFSNGGYLALNSSTRQEVLTQAFFNNADGLEVRNKIELVDTGATGGLAKVELDHKAPADNTDIPIHHFSFVKSGEATGVPQMALASELLMIRDGDTLVDSSTHTPLETRGKPPNKTLGYNTTSGEITYIDTPSPPIAGSIATFTITNGGTLFSAGVTQFPANGGSGSGGVFEVTSVGAGGFVTLVFMVSGGTNYYAGDSIYLISNGGGNDCQIFIDTVLPPASPYADLSAGSAVAQQTFTGFNKFDEALQTADIEGENISGDSLTSLGAITSTTDITCGGNVISTPSTTSPDIEPTFVALWAENAGASTYTLKRESTLSFLVVVQNFIGSAASVRVNGTARPAYVSGTRLHSTSNFVFYNDSPFEYMILHFGGIYKICFRGQLEISPGLAAGGIPANTWGMTWLDMLYLFGDYETGGTQPSGLINQEDPLGTTKKRYFGTDDEHFSAITRRLSSTGNYNGINGECSNLASGTSASDLGFMRFTESLNYTSVASGGDRVIFDSTYYWADGPP